MKKAKKHAIILQTLICILVFCISCSESKKADTLDIVSALKPELAGFTRTTEVRHFDREGLWQHINGAADLYLSHGFEKLALADYADEKAELAAEIYAFANMAGADSIYSSYSAGDNKIINVGDRGVSAPGQVVFRRGAIVVMINYYSNIPDRLIEDFAAALDSNLPR